MQTIRSVLHSGSHGLVVEAECGLSNGLPGIIIVGLGNKAVDESRERIRSAFAATKIPLPRKRITINLAPADIPKESTSLDLPIAVALMHTSPLAHKPAAHEAFIGELGLDGSVRAVRGIIGKITAGKKAGITTFFVPTANLEQALLVPGVTVIPINSLQPLYASFLAGGPLLQPAAAEEIASPLTLPPSGAAEDLTNVAGQARAKRALIIAAAGGHNLFLTGPPGTGKSMLAKALPSLLPPLSREEMLEVTHLHSLTSANYDQLITTRPFRTPHHTTSHIALTGGGSRLRPGEISLSHRGVLFLDELPEFNRQAIEALRQPLEDRIITLTRAKDSAVYPAHFILVATGNPCPCGYYESSQPCTCPAYRITQYREKLSGPIMDRIDLYAAVEEVDHATLLTRPLTQQDEYHNAVERVTSARDRQYERYHNRQTLNCMLSNAGIRTYAKLEPKAHTLLNAAAGRLRISARSYMRIIKVARTIADLEGSTDVTVTHVSEALQYRQPTRNMNSA